MPLTKPKRSLTRPPLAGPYDSRAAGYDNNVHPDVWSQINETFSEHLSYQGVYAGGTTYQLNDLVVDSNGHLYRYINAASASGQALTNTAYWLPFITAGDTINPLWFGFSPSATASANTAALQAAINAADSSKKALVCYHPGPFAIDPAVTIQFKDHDVDMSNVVLSVTSPTTITVLVQHPSGGANLILGRSIRLPKIAGTKAALGWANASTGIRIVNLYQSQVYIPHVANHQIGLQVSGTSGQGTSDNVITLGNIENNRTGVRLYNLDDTGWVNENLFLKGRIWMWGDEGTGVASSRAILIEDRSSGSIPNANIFLQPDLEGDGWEFNAEIQGVDNAIEYGRWETTTPKVKYTSQGAHIVQRNRIQGGYQVGTIVFTKSGNVQDNHWDAALQLHRTGDLRLENRNSSSDPVLLAYEAATDSLTAGSNDWSANLSSLFYRGKAKAHTYPTIELDHSNGRIKLGFGTSALYQIIECYWDGAASWLRVTGDDLLIDNQHLRINNGAWDGGHLILGSYHLWIDGTGDLRIKSSAPSSDTDGTVVGTQT